MGRGSDQLAVWQIPSGLRFRPMVAWWPAAGAIARRMSFDLETGKLVYRLPGLKDIVTSVVTRAMAVDSSRLVATCVFRIAW